MDQSGAIWKHNKIDYIAREWKIREVLGRNDKCISSEVKFKYGPIWCHRRKTTKSIIWHQNGK